VGTECVSNSYGKVIRKVIKEFLDNETRKKAKDFLTKYIEWTNTQFAYSKPTSVYEKERLTYIAYEGKKIATQMIEEFEKTSVRKLANFMKKHEKELLIQPVIQVYQNYPITNLKELVKAYGNGNNLKIGFGKYKDKMVGDVDSTYIDWAKKEVMK
jgi:hypothetical protein